MTRAGYRTALLAVILSVSSPPWTRAGEIDWQRTAEQSAWAWSAEQAGPLLCIQHSDRDYDIRLDVRGKPFREYVYTILRDGEDVYSWKGHPATVFRILDDTLYYVQFSVSGSGGNAVGVDLTTGKELWESPLVALGPIEHSSYQNLINLGVNGEVMWVYGNESLGRYLEYKNIDTGKTVGHKIFERPNQP
jgi:hypothetical protein